MSGSGPQQVPADRIDHLRALAHQQIARAEHHLSARIRAVRMKSSLPNIQPDRAWLCHGRPIAVIAKAVRDTETCLAASAAWQPEQEIPLPTL